MLFVNWNLMNINNFLIVFLDQTEKTVLQELETKFAKIHVFKQRYIEHIVRKLLSGYICLLDFKLDLLV